MNILLCALFVVVTVSVILHAYKKGELGKQVNNTKKVFQERVKVEFDNGTQANLIRVYDNNEYKYYLLDGTYVSNLYHYSVIHVEPMTTLWFKNQDSISYKDIESPEAMRPEQLEKLRFFKN